MLKAVGSSAAVGTLGVSQTSAEGRIDIDAEGCKAENAYNSAKEVEDLINECEKFVETLFERGYLPAPRVAIDELLSDDEYLQSEEGARSWGMQYYGGHATPHITVRREVPGGRMTIAFNPDMGNGIRAIVKPDALVDVESPRLGYEVTLIRADGADVLPEVEEKGYLPKTPDEISKINDGSTITESELSPEGMVIYGCKQYGGYGCDTRECMQWEGECTTGDECH